MLSCLLVLFLQSEFALFRWCWHVTPGEHTSGSLELCSVSNDSITAIFVAGCHCWNHLFVPLAFFIQSSHAKLVFALDHLHLLRNTLTQRWLRMEKMSRMLSTYFSLNACARMAFVNLGIMWPIWFWSPARTQHPPAGQKSPFQSTTDKREHFQRCTCWIHTCFSRAACLRMGLVPSLEGPLLLIASNSFKPSNSFKLTDRSLFKPAKLPVSGRDR